MIPLRDNIPSRTTPVVNYGIIWACTICFFFQITQSDDEPSMVETLGMIPARITDPGEEVLIPDRWIEETPRGRVIREGLRPAAPPAVPPLLTLVTCVFLHGGWMHFLGNMWFLYIFGDNVEDRFGHFGYLAFYLAWGILASLAHLLTNWGSPIPTIGASGAIAGVMGAYMLLYPHARVLTLIPIFIIIQIVNLRAPLFLGIWFLIQFFQGAMSITSEATTGVAWWAHIGGFAVGAATAWILGSAHRLSPQPEIVTPDSEHFLYRREPSPRNRNDFWS